jgi:FG-GAP repeat
VTDFNGDGFADLAIGIPFENVEGTSNAGAVQVLYGSASGLTSIDQFWTQNAIGTDPSEVEDEFGTAVATGDFDADGFTDLAIGAPSEDVGATGGAGAVNVLYGSSTGLAATGDQFWTQNSSAVLDSSEGGDQFGENLAAGDFNGDGRSDLAVGVPFEDVGGVGDAGVVNMLYGSSTGLTATGNQLWTQDSTGVLDSAESGDAFGWSLTAADFGKSSQADLAIGVFFEDVGGAIKAGAVNVLYGSSIGLTEDGNQFWTQNSSGILNSSEGGDDFGFSLAAANFGKGTQSDLAVGVPFEDLGAINNAGAVNVLYGSSTGLTTTGNQVWSQNSTGILDSPEDADDVGFSLAAANFGKGTQSDLAIGVPFEDVGVAGDAGAVNVLYGSSAGLTRTGNQFWTQDSTGIVDSSEAFDGFGLAVGSANFGKSTQADLAVGVADENVEAISNAGAVNVLYGSSDGLTAAGDQFWNQDATGILDSAETGDHFGWSLAPRRGGRVFLF